MQLPRLISGTKLTLQIALLVLLAGMAVWSAIRGRGPLGTSRITAEECRAAYQRAQTSTDSSMVDNQTPIVSRGQAAFAKSCQMMRLDGDLSRLR